MDAEEVTQNFPLVAQKYESTKDKRTYIVDSDESDDESVDQKNGGKKLTVVAKVSN
jgi:hypothetical protein